MSIFLIPLIFGILDYGMWFADSLATRDGARGAARAASTGQYGSLCARTYLTSPGTDQAISPDLEGIACQAAAQTSPLSGEVFVRVRLITDPGTTDPTSSGEATWSGAPVAVRVCVAVKHEASIPGVPLPNGGLGTSKVQMPIEAVHDPVDEGGGYGGAAPTDWSWC